MDAAGDTGIKRVDHPDHFDGTGRIGHRYAYQRLSNGPGIPSAHRGPKFQVVGTTIW